MNDLFDKGQKAFNEDNIKEAIKCFEVFAQANPLDPRVLMYLGVCFRKDNNLNKSLEYLDRGVNVLPQDPHFLSERGVTKLHLKDNTGALKDMDLAVSLDPDNSYRYSSRAFIRNSIGDLDGAESDYQKAIELDPEDAIAYNNLGILQENRGRKGSAKKNYDRASTISKTNPDFKGLFNQATEEEQKARQEKLVKEHSVKEAKSTSPVAPETNSSKPSFAKHYFQTLGSVFKNKKERQAFFEFIKKGLKRG